MCMWGGVLCNSGILQGALVVLGVCQPPLVHLTCSLCHIPHRACPKDNCRTTACLRAISSINDEALLSMTDGFSVWPAMSMCSWSRVCVKTRVNHVQAGARSCVRVKRCGADMAGSPCSSALPLHNRHLHQMISTINISTRRPRLVVVLPTQ